MMGIMMIDGAAARLDGLVEVTSDFYFRRMTLASDLPKRVLSIDPPLRMEF